MNGHGRQNADDILELSDGDVVSMRQLIEDMMSDEDARLREEYDAYLAELYAKGDEPR